MSKVICNKVERCKIKLGSKVSSCLARREHEFEKGGWADCRCSEIFCDAIKAMVHCIPVKKRRKV